MSKYTDKVLEIVRTIPPGKVVSYGQVALLAGVSRGARSVGGVLCSRGDNTPWWRVINNAGRISTTCLEHNAISQKELLENEGVTVSNDLKIDISKYRWQPNISVINKLELEEDVLDALLKRYF